MTENLTAAELIGELMSASHAASNKTANDLMVAWKAERDAYFDGVTRALSQIPWGRTTAEYEAGLDLVRAALHPSPYVLEQYRSQAELYMKGKAESSHKIDWDWGNWPESTTREI